MRATMNVDRADPKLLGWLDRQAVDFEIHEHDAAFTARTTAAAEGVDARTFAKVLGVVTGEGKRALFVLDATDKLDLRKARIALGHADVRLLTEAELADVAPDCEVGAIPAVGSLFGLPTYADYAVREDPEISFNAGSHRYSVRVERAGWERACSVTYADLAADADSGPAWARS